MLRVRGESQRRWCAVRIEIAGGKAAGDEREDPAAGLGEPLVVSPWGLVEPASQELVSVALLLWIRRHTPTELQCVTAFCNSRVRDLIQGHAAVVLRVSAVVWR